MLGMLVDHLSAQFTALQDSLSRTLEDTSRTDEGLDALAVAMRELAERQPDHAAQIALLSRIAEAQESRETDDEQDGIDPASRMHLRSIDTQMLRILEELTAGRQEVIVSLRRELDAIARKLQQEREGLPSMPGDR